MGERRRWFLETQSIGEDAAKIVEVITKDLEHDRNSVDKAVAGSERIESNFGRSSVGKMLSNSVSCYREITDERESQSVQQTSLLSYLRNHQSPQPSATTTLVSRQPSAWRQDPPPVKRLRITEGSDDG